AIYSLRRPVSLKALLAAAERNQVVVVVQVRDLSILRGVSTLAELREKFKNARATRGAVTALTDMVTGVGGSLKSLSRDGQVLGIAGTAGSLGTLQITPLPNDQQVKAIEHETAGIGLIGTAILGVLALPEDLPILGVIAAGAAGGALGAAG